MHIHFCGRLKQVYKGEAPGKEIRILVWHGPLNIKLHFLSEVTAIDAMT